MRIIQSLLAVDVAFIGTSLFTDDRTIGFVLFGGIIIVSVAILIIIARPHK